MSKGYTSVGLVSQAVGRVFSVDQQATVDNAIGAVEEFLDDWSGEVYSGAAGIVDELVPVTPPKDTTQGLPGTAVLAGFPVGAIQSVRSAPGGQGVEVAYVVTDLAHGTFTVQDYVAYAYLWVSYSTLKNVPGMHREVATRYAAFLVRTLPGFGGTTMLPPTGPISAYSLGSDIRFEFRGEGLRGSYGRIPPGLPLEVWPFLVRMHRWSLA